MTPDADADAAAVALFFSIEAVVACFFSVGLEDDDDAELIIVTLYTTATPSHKQKSSVELS